MGKHTMLTLAAILAVVAAGSFHSALAFTLPHEGIVYENVAGDPGGPTCCGITHADYDAYRHEHNLPEQDVSLISANDVASVYREHYWQPLRCDELPGPLAEIMFDTGVNVGVVRPVRWLQTALGVSVDGNLGPQTLASVGFYVTKHGAPALAAAVLRQREAYYLSLGSWAAKFRNGWLTRCDDLGNAVGITDAALA